MIGKYGIGVLIIGFFVLIGLGLFVLSPAGIVFAGGVFFILIGATVRMPVLGGLVFFLMGMLLIGLSVLPLALS